MMGGRVAHRMAESVPVEAEAVAEEEGPLPLSLLPPSSCARSATMKSGVSISACARVTKKRVTICNR